MKIDLNKLKNLKLEDVTGIASAVFMGVVAVKNALDSQKKEKEFEAMKKAVAELTEKK